MRRIILTEYKGKLLYSLWEEDKPAELALYPLEDGGIPRLRDIYLGRVQDVVQGIRAAFVRLTPECTAYLPLTADTANIKAGDELALQVIKEAHRTLPGGRRPAAVWRNCSQQIDPQTNPQIQPKVKKKVRMTQLLCRTALD